MEIPQGPDNPSAGEPSKFDQASLNDDLGVEPNPTIELSENATPLDQKPADSQLPEAALDTAAEVESQEEKASQLQRSLERAQQAYREGAVRVVIGTALVGGGVFEAGEGSRALEFGGITIGAAILLKGAANIAEAWHRHRAEKDFSKAQIQKDSL